jgi:hypothetical protein
MATSGATTSSVDSTASPVANPSVTVRSLVHHVLPVRSVLLPFDSF